MYNPYNNGAPQIGAGAGPMYPPPPGAAVIGSGATPFPLQPGQVIGTGAYPGFQPGIGGGAYPGMQPGIGGGAYPAVQPGIGGGAFPVAPPVVPGIGGGAYPGAVMPPAYVAGGNVYQQPAVIPAYSGGQFDQPYYGGAAGGFVQPVCVDRRGSCSSSSSDSCH
ncbi:unnamed protein product, partial [Mesorhabditis spiculigera]